MPPVILADNRFLDGLPTATETAPGYDVLNIRDGRSYTKWRANAPGSIYINIDCGQVRSADHFGIQGHNLGTSGTSASLESSDTGVGGWTGRVSSFIPSSDRPVLKSFGQAAARYWRIGLSGGVLAPEIAIAMPGVGIVFPRYPEAPYAKIQFRQETDRVLSKAGQLIGLINRFKEFRANPTWTHIEASFVDNQLYPFVRDYGASGSPFIWSWDPLYHPDEVFLARLRPGFVFNPTKTIMSYYDRVSLDMEGILEY